MSYQFSYLKCRVKLWTVQQLLEVCLNCYINNSCNKNFDLLLTSNHSPWTIKPMALSKSDSRASYLSSVCHIQNLSFNIPKKKRQP